MVSLFIQGVESKTIYVYFLRIFPINLLLWSIRNPVRLHDTVIHNSQIKGALLSCAWLLISLLSATPSLSPPSLSPASDASQKFLISLFRRCAAMRSASRPSTISTCLVSTELTPKMVQSINKYSIAPRLLTRPHKNGADIYALFFEEATTLGSWMNCKGSLVPTSK